MARACLILDFDGTILDTEGPVYRSWAELWDEVGHELVLTEWQKLIGVDNAFDPWEELEQRAGHPLDRALQDRRRARRDELLANEKIRDGVLDWLGEADRVDVPVAIASSSPMEWVEDHLTRLGLRHRFMCLTCRDEVVPSKPDPTSYRLACERLGADAAVSVAVEDSPNGVRAAVRASLFTVAVPHGLTADLDLSAAHLRVASLVELTLADALVLARARADRIPSR